MCRHIHTQVLEAQFSTNSQRALPLLAAAGVRILLFLLLFITHFEVINNFLEGENCRETGRSVLHSQLPFEMYGL